MSPDFASSIHRPKRPRISLGCFLCLIAMAGSAQTAFGQSNVRVHSLACQTSTGSAAAAESLNRLQTLPAETPDLQEAIAACQVHMEELRKQEDSQWNMAVAARDRSDCQAARRLFQGLLQKRTAYQRQARDEMNQLSNCVQAAPERSPDLPGGANAVNTLQQARGAFNTRNFSLARSLAQSIASRPDQIGEEAKSLLRSIDSIEMNNKRYRDANVAIARRQFDQACSLLRNIESSDASFAGLSDAKKRAGGCPVPEPAVDLLKPEYEEAKSLLEARKYKEAADKLKSILARDANYADADHLLQQAENGIKEQMPVAAKQAVPAKQPSEPSPPPSETRKVQEKITSVPKAQPEDNSRKTADVLSSSSSESEEELLFLGMDSFYSDNHTQARQILGDFAAAKHPPRLLALACFYLGATAITEYYLEGATDQKKRQEGMLRFEEALHHDRNFSPPWDAVSPKIRAIYVEATGRRP